MAASEGLFSFILQENWLRRIFCRSLVLPFAHTDPKQRFSVKPCVFVWNGSKPPVLQKHVLQSDQKMTFCKRAGWKRRNARRPRSIRVSMWPWGHIDKWCGVACTMFLPLHLCIHPAGDQFNQTSGMIQCTSKFNMSKMSNHEMKFSVFHFPLFLKAKKKQQSCEIKHLSRWGESLRNMPFFNKWLWA